MAAPEGFTMSEYHLLTDNRSRFYGCPTIQHGSLQTHCPLDNGRLQPPHAVFQRSTVGDLEALHLEIIHLTLGVLDVQSLTNFRAVSWRARDLVDSLPPYKAVVEHFPDALRALLSTRVAGCFTAQDIFDALCARDCFNCGQFGPLLDLFTCYRCCITCMTTSDNLLSVKVSLAKNIFGLDSKAMRTLTPVVSLPGPYICKVIKRRYPLFRLLQAKAAGSASVPELARRFDMVKRLDAKNGNVYRYMPMIEIPTLDRKLKTGNLDWGVFCRACRSDDDIDAYLDGYVFYTTAGFVEHFQKCQFAQEGREWLRKRRVPEELGARIKFEDEFDGFLKGLHF